MLSLMPKKYQARRSGFTLIELIVVIVLIGIVTAIAVPDYRQYQMREQMRTAISLTQSTLGEGFAAARAQSQSQVMTICENGIRQCNQPVGANVIGDCNLVSLPVGATECEFAALPDNLLITSPSPGTQWKYLAPHGDLDLTGSLEITFEHQMGDTQTLKLYHRSGLIELPR